MSGLRVFRSLLVSGFTCIALIACAATAQAQQYDPSPNPSQPEGDGAPAPGRVARLAYLSGQVQFAPAGENDWGSVAINRPMVIGDRLLTGDDGLAVLELGDASVRIDHDSAFDFLNLDEDNVQIELSQGTLNLAVRQINDGGNFEVDTPTVAFVASTPGVYRIDDSPTGTGTMVTVFHGSGIVYGENGVSRQVTEGASYRFNDSTLASVDVNGLPQPDAFDRFCEARDANYARYAGQEQQYVPPDMIGADELYQYGQWDAVPEYGNVWYPRSVPVGWAPYRYGHWAWIDPWGWTWVDDQPWGFAPFHYGRWVHIRNRWGWLPGPVNVRPVYAPALVAFIGGSGVSLSIGVGAGPVGWFPLGPRDVYVPWFHASRRYFTNVNVTNLRRVYVNRVVINNFYNDYREHRYTNIHRHNPYRYRNQAGAITLVPRKVFTDARPVRPAVLKLDRSQLAHARVTVRPDVNPGKASLGLRRPTTRPAVFHGREPFARPVVARHAPPPRPVDFAARQKVIARQHGQPLSAEQMRNLVKARPASGPRDERVRLVAGATRKTAIDSIRPRAATLPHAKVSAHAAPARPQVQPHPAEVHARSDHALPSRESKPPARQAPLRPGELPSARFRNAERPATLPRPPVLRPAEEPRQSRSTPERLPVVRPLERAAQPPRANIQAQQRARTQQIQQQRQMREQLQPRTPQDQRQQAAARQERVREQQAQQQRRVEERAQQQGAAQIQAEQRARTQQIQQQRQMRQMRIQPTQPIQRETRQREVQRPPERYVPRPANRPAPGQRRGRPVPNKHPDSSSQE